jgi:hypothetical protein
MKLRNPLLFKYISLVFAVLSVSDASSQEIPATAQLIARVEACAASRSDNIDANLEGAINRWRDGLVEGRYTSKSSADFLEQFSDEKIRLEAYKIYIECLASWDALNLGKHRPSTNVSTYSSHEASDFILSYINAVKDGSQIDFIFRIQNLSQSDRKIYYSGVSYSDNNGIICDQGNFLRQINGINSDARQGPSTINSGETLQFTDKNVGCANTDLSGVGAITVWVDEIDSVGQAKRINFNIFDVNVRK